MPAGSVLQLALRLSPGEGKWDLWPIGQVVATRVTTAGKQRPSLMRLRRLVPFGRRWPLCPGFSECFGRVSRNCRMRQLLAHRARTRTFIGLPPSHGWRWKRCATRRASAAWQNSAPPRPRPGSTHTSLTPPSTPPKSFRKRSTEADASKFETSTAAPPPAAPEPRPEPRPRGGSQGGLRASAWPSCLARAGGAREVGVAVGKASSKRSWRQAPSPSGPSERGGGPPREAALPPRFVPKVSQRSQESARLRKRARGAMPWPPPPVPPLSSSRDRLRSANRRVSPPLAMPLREVHASKNG